MQEENPRDKAHGGHRNYMDQIIRPPTRQQTPVLKQPQRKQLKKSRRFKKYTLYLFVFLLLVGVVAGGCLYVRDRNFSPVPNNITKSVSFPIYYPDPNKLPAGYTLSLSSFSNPQEDAVLYSVDYDRGKRLVFSLQQKPSDSDIQSFYANYIPLRNELQTPSGKAEIGAYNNKGNLQTLVSLPTNDTTWLIITAPADINQDHLKQVLASLKKN